MNRAYLGAWMLATLAAACSSPAQEKSTGTNWLECHDAADFARGDGATCRNPGVCVDRDGHPIPANRVDGSGGASGGSSGHGGVDAGTMNGNGGRNDAGVAHQGGGGMDAGMKNGNGGSAGKTDAGAGNGPGSD